MGNELKTGENFLIVVSDDSSHILKTHVLDTVPSFPCDLEQVIECCRDLCFFICDMGTLFLPCPAPQGRAING